MRVLVVDDHAAVRQAYARRLALEPDILVVGEAADGREAIERTTEVRPDVVLMDIAMPVLDGVHATRVIHAEHPAVCVIGLSMDDRPEQAKAMRDAGAMDYVVKGTAVEELLVVMRGCVAFLREQSPPDAAA